MEIARLVNTNTMSVSVTWKADALSSRQSNHDFIPPQNFDPRQQALINLQFSELNNFYRTTVTNYLYVIELLVQKV